MSTSIEKNNKEKYFKNFKNEVFFIVLMEFFLNLDCFRKNARKKFTDSFRGRYVFVI